MMAAAAAAAGGSGQLSVPPGFRFHPTDEELLHYYLRKKVSYEAIDLDVIREVDLNKLEPWDLKDKCTIGSCPQNEWYFFSHKDKKYPTGTRTNRATTAGFWKATGRDKAIHLGNSKRIGMRKTLVFYIGRAPHGQKTEWIMHEYRLDDENADIQEDGWVVCRVFKKKNNPNRGFQPDNEVDQNDHEEHNHHHQHHLSTPPQMKLQAGVSSSLMMEYPIKQNPDQAPQCDYSWLDGSVHLPQLLSPDVADHQSMSAINHHHPNHPSFLPLHSLNGMVEDLECNSQNLLSLISSGSGGGGFVQNNNEEKFSNDWTFLDKLLASHQSFDPQSKFYSFISPSATATAARHHHHHHHHNADVVSSSAQKFPLSFSPFDYVGSEPEFLKFSHK